MGTLKVSVDDWFRGLFRRPFSARRFARIIVTALGIIALVVGIAFLLGFFVMLLWNWLMPDIFGLPEITYWQAWGLVLLSHILIKGSSSRGREGRRERRGDDGHSGDYDQTGGPRDQRDDQADRHSGTAEDRGNSGPETSTADA